MKVHGRRDLPPLVDNVLFKIAKWGLSFDDHFTYYIDYYCRHPQAPRQWAAFWSQNSHRPNVGAKPTL
jgi:hypothetical protein